MSPHPPYAPSVLVVDDDPDVRDCTADALDLAGYRVTAVPGARDAIEHLNVHPEVDVVLTDIRMPGMNGIELTRHVRTHHGASVIMMTGFSGEFAYEEILAQGAADFAQKPLRPAELHARVARVLAARAADRDRDLTRDRLDHSLARLRRTLDGVVRAIATSVEMRDPYTAGHQERVARIAVQIAQRLGLAEDDVEGLEVAAGLHDLGKLAVPAEILTKPGDLTSLEHQLIETHVQAGYDILRNIEFPWPVAETVYQHHERLDGSGYPRGLHGPEIRREARILAVADVLETIASHRPYRPAKGLDAALVELADHCGSLYDADVARAALELAETGGLESGAPAPAQGHGLPCLRPGPLR